MSTRFFPGTELTPLLRAFREAGIKKSLLALEVVLLGAERPRTMAELEALTGVKNSRLSIAVRTLTPWWDARAEVVRRPALHLLQRRRRFDGQGHRIHLTSRGRKLLTQTTNGE